MADPTRRDLLTALRVGPASVARLAEAVPVSRPAVSQHLKVLRDNGLVTFDPVGTSNVYRLDPSGLEALRAWLDDFWAQALESYAAHTESQLRKEARP